MARGEWLYNLEADSPCHMDVAVKYPETVNLMKARLKLYHRGPDVPMNTSLKYLHKGQLRYPCAKKLFFRTNNQVRACTPS